MREKWLDNAKAFTIILVVFAHCLTDIGGNAILGKTFNCIYGFHMPLFFLLSGISFALMLKKNGSIKRFTRQLIKLVLLYIVFSLIYVFFNLILGKIINIHTDIGISNIFILWKWPVAQYWYLYVLFFLYIFAYAFHKLVEYTTRRVEEKEASTEKIVVIVKAGILIICLILAFLNPLSKIWIVKMIIKYMFFFEFGQFAYELTEKISLWLIFPFAVIGISYCYMNNSLNDYILVAFAIVMSLFITVINRRYINYGIGIFTTIGRQCVWIFLLHNYFTSVTATVCGKIFPNIMVIRIVTSTLAGIFGPLLIGLIFGAVTKRFTGIKKK